MDDLMPGLAFARCEVVMPEKVVVQLVVEETAWWNS
jgi:hypothetical protein